MTRPNIEVIRGSVIDQDVDVIVNAANTDMRGGAGINGAIQKAAGDGLLVALQYIAPNGGYTSIPVVTKGHRLEQEYILHVAGPRYTDGSKGEPFQLSMCFMNCLTVANQLRLRDKDTNDVRYVTSIAFPSISTGIFGYPLTEAADIVVQTINTFFTANPVTNITDVVLAMFQQEEYDIYSDALESLNVSLALFRSVLWA